MTITDQLAEALRPFAKMADRTPIMTGRGENTRERHPGDNEKYDFGADVTWGLLRYAKAAIAAYDAQPKVESGELVRQARALYELELTQERTGEAADRIAELEAQRREDTEVTCPRCSDTFTALNVPITRQSRPVVTATDEMVERACAVWRKKRPEHVFWEEDEAAMRAALEAALSASAGKEGGE